MSEEGALEKSGAELFKELLRFYPVAEVDDYFKHGQWKDEVMKVDLQLVEQHRREAGAPDPVALEDVEMPELPKVMTTAWAVGGVGLPGAVRPAMPGAVTVPVRPGGAVVPGATAAGGAAAAGGPVAELRLIALFVAKWKLDPTKTKMMLAKMTPQKRRYVIQNFKTTTPGAEATTELETFIATCEKTNAWAEAAAAPAGAVTPVRPATPGALGLGVKRPLVPQNPLVLDPSKRPRITAPISIAPKAGAVVTPQQAMAARMQPAGTVRPPMGGVRPPMAGTVRPPMWRGW